MSSSLRLPPAHIRVVDDSTPAHKKPVVLEDFVHDLFEGLIGDYAVPFPTQESARLAAEYQLTEYGGRRLTQHERHQVALEVTFEWNRRAQSAKVLAFMGRAD